MLRKVLALALGAPAAALGGWLAFIAVKREVFRWHAASYDAGPEMVFVVFFAVAFGVVAAFFAWRALVGPPLERTEWTLLVPPAAPSSRAIPHVADLVASLEALGYAIDVSAVDEAGVATTKLEGVARDRPLAGAPLEIVERHLGRRRGRLVLRLPTAREGEALGFLDLHAAVDGAYEELARFCLATLGDLVPGLAFRHLASALEMEPATSLREQLPERPERLPLNHER